MSTGQVKLEVDTDDDSKIPRNFSWVIDDQLCAMGFPGHKENMNYLVKNNILYLLSLTAECQPPVTNYDIKHLSVKILDFTPPTLDQIDICLKFMQEAIQNGKAVGIHCAHGKGRTGTVLACYFVKYLGMTADQAISRIRFLRPGSIETNEQESTVYKYEQNL